MMKKLLIAIVGFLSFICCGICSAEEGYTEEVYLKVGDTWSLNIPNVMYEVDNKAICELRKDEKSNVFFILPFKAGDIVVVSCDRNGNRTDESKYLLHVTGSMPLEEVHKKVGFGYDYFLPQYTVSLANIMNLMRKDAGKPPMELNRRLFFAAVLRAEKLANKRNKEKVNAWKEVIEKDGNIVAVGESFFSGKDRPIDFFSEMLMKSKLKANLFEPEFRSIGIGHYYNEKLPRKHYWVVIFLGMRNLGKK